MIEGCHNDEYLVLFEDQLEAIRITEKYGVQDYVPGYSIIGLRGWDEFILLNAKQEFFTIPTVPLEPDHLEAYRFSVNLASIQPDQRFRNKVKWYMKPILFGGDASEKENMTWITYDQHAELVRWWAKLYRETIQQK